MITGAGRTRRLGTQPAGSVRILLALVVSIVVTVAVSGPMAFEAYHANRTTLPRHHHDHAEHHRAAVGLSETTLPGRDSVALGGTTEVPATTDGTGTTTPGSGGSTVTTVPRRTTAPTPATSAAPGPRPTTAGPAPTTVPPGTSTVVEPPGTTTTTTVPVPGDGIVFALSAGQRDRGPSPRRRRAVGCGSTSRAPAWTWSASGRQPLRDRQSRQHRGAVAVHAGAWSHQRPPVLGLDPVADGQHSVLTEVVTTTGSSTGAWPSSRSAHRRLNPGTRNLTGRATARRRSSPGGRMAEISGTVEPGSRASVTPLPATSTCTTRSVPASRSTSTASAWSTSSAASSPISDGPRPTPTTPCSSCSRPPRAPPPPPPTSSSTGASSTSTLPVTEYWPEFGTKGKEQRARLVAPVPPDRPARRRPSACRWPRRWPGTP